MLKKLAYLFVVLLLIGGVAAYWGYNLILSSNTAFEEENATIQIPSNSSFEDVLALIEENNVLKDISSFQRVAGWMNYDRDKIPSGSFEIEKGWNNKQIISKLRSGVQKPKTLTFNNVRTIQDLMGPLSQNVQFDSLDALAYFTDPTNLESLGYSNETILSMFIPNSYEVYWDISLDKLAARMKKEHDSFWSRDERKSKAEALNLTESEVYTLASIVEKESQHGPERPIIAGLYLNRLKKGIPLQADPTVVFANGDFGLRRVLNKHLRFDSPYNTYIYKGLPPGPIYMPSIESIDAVLNAEKHDYLFMCAKPGFGSQHAFAKTNRGHEKNARIYREWLSQQGIK